MGIAIDREENSIRQKALTHRIPGIGADRGDLHRNSEQSGAKPIDREGSIWNEDGL